MRAHKRGVEVRIVTESSSVNEREISQLAASGVEVPDDQRQNPMHHKFLVVERVEFDRIRQVSLAWYSARGLVILKAGRPPE